MALAHTRTNPVVSPLTKTEKLVLNQLSLGRDPQAGAAELDMGKGTFNTHVQHIGHKFHVKGPAVRLQMAYVTEQLPLPEPLAPPAEFSTEERRLWLAVALHLAPAARAKEAGVQRSEVSGAVKELMLKVGAHSEPHLVRLGHAFGVLTTEAIPPPVDLDS